MMRVRLAVPDAAVGPETLNPMLEAVTRTNEYLLQNGHVPHADQAIASGVKWRPEPPGDEHFDIASTVLRRGHGDCDDLAPYKAASLRITGEDPDAQAIVVPSGRNKWHAVVQRADGSIDDPSADAGMYEYRPPLQPRMMGPTSKPHIATKQVGSVWCARCDVPWKGTRHAISGHGMATTQGQAAATAIESAAVVGEASGVADEEHLLRLAALQALMRGQHPEAVRQFLRVNGQDVGFSFGKLLRTAAHLAPIPGVSTAFDAAEAAASLLKKKKRSGPGPTVGPRSSSSASSATSARSSSSRNGYSRQGPPGGIYNQGPLFVRF